MSTRALNLCGKERGAALVLVMILVAVFFILMGTLIDVLELESQNATESADANAALTAAYSGVDLMILSIEEYYQNSVQNGQFPTQANCDFQDPGGGSVSTTCQAEVTKTYNGNGINYYLISSTGYANPSEPQEVQRSVEALVKEIPFGAYSQFSETETTNTGGKVWYSSKQSFSGPVYSGGNMNIRYDSSIQTPIFPYGFTTSKSQGSVSWYDIADGNTGPPNTPQEVASVFGPGATATYNASPLLLPGFAQNLIIFSEAYWGDAVHDSAKDLQDANQAPGVYVNGAAGTQCSGAVATGIFVQGNAVISSTATPASNGDLSSGTETWTISSPNHAFTTTTVTVDFAGAGTTTVVTGPTTCNYTGVASGEAGNGSLGNGAIFVNGSVEMGDNSLVHGQYTLAVPDPPQNGNKIQLDGSLTYANDPNKGQTSEDELALWADKIFLESNDPSVTIEGMILTGYSNECTNAGCGGYFANGFCNRLNCGGGSGALTLYGSVIENMRGKMGEVDSSGDLVGGYLRDLIYDARLGATPPPFSPTTNIYSIVALSDRGMNCLIQCPGVPAP